MAEIKNVKYEKRVRKPSTDTSPTMASLLGSKDKKVKVTIPKLTRAFDVAYEPIQLNAHARYEPGQSYMVHPVIAEELNHAIENFEQSIILQMTKRNKAAEEAGILTPDQAMQVENMIEVA